MTYPVHNSVDSAMLLPNAGWADSQNPPNARLLTEMPTPAHKAKTNTYWKGWDQLSESGSFGTQQQLYLYYASK